MNKFFTSTLFLLFTLTAAPLQAFYFDQSTQSEQVSNEQVIDINKADEETLAQLKGVGKKRAKAIVAYRALNGDFVSVEALLNVKGIGNQVLVLNKARIRL